MNSSPQYVQVTLPTVIGDLKLVVFPDDALWVCQQVEKVAGDLDHARCAFIHVGSNAIILERDIAMSELRFFVQCYRPSDPTTDIEPELEIIDLVL